MTVSTSSPFDHYAVVTIGGMYSGEWLVVRKHDMALMTSTPSPHQAARWVHVWGPMSLNHPKAKLSGRATEQLKEFLSG